MKLKMELKNDVLTLVTRKNHEKLLELANLSVSVYPPNSKMTLLEDSSIWATHGKYK
jgi:hypothetical protein